MDWPLVTLVSGVVGILQSLPLRAVARFGRVCGSIAWSFDARHRTAAIDNLSRCLKDSHSPESIRSLARENFRRIGENFACAVRTACMDRTALEKVLEVEGVEKLRAAAAASQGRSVVALGHFGNFELFAKLAHQVPGSRFATTYRGLRQPGLNRLLQRLRTSSGCLFFERRHEAEALKDAMNRGATILGLLADQHGGTKGVWGPFLGRECSTSSAPAVLALRYKCPLLTAICYRTSLAHWRIEVGDPIPTHEGTGHARPVEHIIRDLNHVLEAAVRRDPANWFWVHRRWKPRS